MRYCPNCRTEYEPHVTACVDCDAGLVDALPVREPAGEPVALMEAATAEEARTVVATLQAEGIDAFVMAQDAALPISDLQEHDPHRVVWVPAAEAAQAAAVLAEPTIDPAALEEAEIAGAEVPGEIAEYDRDLTDEETASEA